MFGMDTSELIRAAVGFAVVLANWFVYRGVALEESNDPWTKDTGKLLLRRALFAETILALGLLFADSWISIGQKSEIIVLQKRLATRVLSDAQITEIKRDLSQFTGQQFLFDAYAVKEVSDLGRQISGALVSAGWVGHTQ